MGLPERKFTLLKDTAVQISQVERQYGEDKEILINPALHSEISKRAVEVAANCPQPKRDDIYRLMAVHAHALGEYSLMFLDASRNSIRNKKFYLDYGMKLMKESRAGFQALLSDNRFDSATALPPPAPKQAPVIERLSLEASDPDEEEKRQEEEDDEVIEIAIESMTEEEALQEIARRYNEGR